MEGKRAGEQLSEAVERQLRLLESYGRLAGEQVRLIEEEDYPRLVRVLDKKDRLLEELREITRLPSLAAAAAREEQPRAALSRELVSVLRERLEYFAGQETLCLEKAAAIRSGMAEQLRLLRQGRKLVRRLQAGTGQRQGPVQGPSDLRVAKVPRSRADIVSR